MGLSVKKFFSVFNQQKFALPEKYFEEKRFLFRKSFLFLLSFLEFEWCLCLIAKLFSQVCQITDHCAERKYWEKEPWKFVFFLFNFWTLSGKNLDFQQNSKAWFSETQPKCADELLQKIFWKQKFLYECFRSMNGNIGFPAKMISQGFQRRSSRVQCNTLRKRW